MNRTSGFWVAIITFLLSSCFEPKEEPVFNHHIKGVLLQSCDNPQPVANTEISLVSNTIPGFIFRDGFRETTMTDENGNFTFEFQSANWGTSTARTATYYAEIQDETEQNFVHGIKPGFHDIGKIYLNPESILKIKVIVDLSSIKNKDYLMLPQNSRKYSFENDTAQYYFYTYLTNENRGIGIENNGISVRWSLYNQNDDLTFRGQEFIYKNRCDTTHTWLFSVPDSVYN